MQRNETNIVSQFEEKINFFHVRSQVKHPAESAVRIYANKGNRATMVCHIRLNQTAK